MSKISHNVVPGAQVHPCQSAFESLINSGLSKMHADCHEKAKKHKITPSLVKNSYIEECIADGTYDELKAKVLEFLRLRKEGMDKSKVAEVKPPPSKVLYERVAGREVIDVGSGDGKRLIRYAKYFDSVTMVEVEDIPKVEGLPDHWESVKEIPTKELPIVSFNVLTQLDDKTVAVVTERDGIHICPKISSFEEVGLSKQVGDVYETTVGDKVFRERKVRSQGVSYGKFYMGLNTYEKSKFEFRLRGPVVVEPDKLMRSFVRLVNDPMMKHCSPKYDGTFLTLRANNGHFTLTDRSGKGRWGTVNTDHKMWLELERLRDRYILLRVCNYRDYRPFHALDQLEKFVRKKELYIGPVVVMAPESIDVRDITLKPPDGCDGYVFRRNEVDYVMNYGVSLDLLSSQKEEVSAYLRNIRGALEVKHVGDINNEGVHSVSVSEHYNGAFVCHWKRRYDKRDYDKQTTWRKKFQLLTVEKYLLGEQNEDLKAPEFEADSDDGDSDDELDY